MFMCVCVNVCVFMCVCVHVCVFMCVVMYVLGVRVRECLCTSFCVYTFIGHFNFECIFRSCNMMIE